MQQNKEIEVSSIDGNISSKSQGFVFGFEASYGWKSGSRDDSVYNYIELRTSSLLYMYIGTRAHYLGCVPRRLGLLHRRRMFFHIDHQYIFLNVLHLRRTIHLPEAIERSACPWDLVS